MHLMHQMSLDHQSQSNPANPGGRIPFDDLQPGARRSTSRSSPPPPNILGGLSRRNSLSAVTLR